MRYGFPTSRKHQQVQGKPAMPCDPWHFPVASWTNKEQPQMQAGGETVTVIGV
jgi:hypothetical protein